MVFQFWNSLEQASIQQLINFSKSLLFYCITNAQFQIILLDRNEKYLEGEIIEGVCCFLCQFLHLILVFTVVLLHVWTSIYNISRLERKK